MNIWKPVLRSSFDDLVIAMRKQYNIQFYLQCQNIGFFSEYLPSTASKFVSDPWLMLCTIVSNYFQQPRKIPKKDIIKPNLPNKTHQTKPKKSNLPNQIFQTKPTKPNLPNQS